MNSVSLVAIAYGLLTVIGGIVGYAKAQSKISLISGCISGLLLVFGGYLYAQGATWGLTLTIAVTALLVAVFAVRLAQSRQFMPAGLMVLLGVAVLAAIGYQS